MGGIVDVQGGSRNLGHYLLFYLRVCFFSKRYFWFSIDLYRFLLENASYYKSKLLKSKK